MFQFGLPGDTPVTGNWQSPSVLGVGIYRPSEGNWYLSTNTSTCPASLPSTPNSVAACNDYFTNYPSNDTTIPFAPVGINTGTAVTGCWPGACPSVSMGFFNGGPWYTGATGSQQEGNFGVSGDVPLAGPWLCPAPTGSGLSITTNTILYGETGVAYSQVLQATGSISPTNNCVYTWTSTDLPSWLTLQPDGTLAGGNSVVGSYSFHVTVTDSSGASLSNVLFTLNLGSFTLTTSTNTNLSGPVGVPIPLNFSLTTTGGYYHLGNTINVSEALNSIGAFQCDSGGGSFTFTYAGQTAATALLYPTQDGILTFTGTFTPSTSSAQCRVQANDGPNQTSIAFNYGQSAPLTITTTLLPNGEQWVADESPTASGELRPTRGLGRRPRGALSQPA